MNCKPASAQAVGKVALLYRNDGQLDTARGYFYRAIKMDPQYAWKKYASYLGEMIEMLEAGGYQLRD